MKRVTAIIGFFILFLFGCVRSPKEKIVHEQKLLKNRIYKTEQHGMLLAMKTSQMQEKYGLDVALTMPEYVAIRKDMDSVADVMLRCNKSYDSLEMKLKKY